MALPAKAPKAPKIVEIYMATLKEYQQKLKKEKLTVLMQVGDFFEIYGIIYPNGQREGNIWEFCDNTNLKIGPKPMVVFNNPEIEVVMGGVQPAYANTYIQKAVDKFGWTIVIFEQDRIGNSGKFDRKESTIISPGININSENFSNITMNIYLEGVKNYLGVTHTVYANAPHSPRTQDTIMVNIGMAFIDCLTGENGLMAINNTPLGEMSIALDELLKLLTIKNPNELTIYLNNVDISDDDLINALHLFNHQFKIFRSGDDKYSKLICQSALLNAVYIKHRGINDIFQQLDIDDAIYYYARIALCTLIDYIIAHDKTIIEKLERPEIILNSDKYLMLANNCLEQLDIIDNMKSTTNVNAQYGFGRRKSLLELLDNTKTPLGRIKLRQRLSIPITSPDILNHRYLTIHEMITMQTNYKIKTKTDKYGSPLYQIRSILSGIRNIDNYLRKVIVGKITPFDMSTYIESLDKCLLAIKFIKSDFSKCSTLTGLLPSNSSNSRASHEQLEELIVQMKTDLILDNCKMLWSDIENNIFKPGVSPALDQLQEELDTDRHFVDNLIEKLTKISDGNCTANGKESVKKQGQINMANNATHGIHLYTTTNRKETLEKYFANAKNDAKNDAIIKVGKHTFAGKEIKFHKMKESKWLIEVPYLKISSGSLKANLERLSKLVKVEFLKWCAETISSKTEVLECLNRISSFIAEIDIIQSNALNAIDNGYSMPKIVLKEHSYLAAKAIRHPIIEQISTSVKYVPNDVTIGSDGGGDGDKYISGILLFGVNAVGKSSLMKSLGINVIMAQAGMYVAASEFVFHPYKYLFTRIRSNDNIYAGLSSFEVEMKEFKVILKYANEDSIILGDEIAKGTVIEDATALVAAGICQLSKRKANFMFATHMHSLTNLDCIKQLANIKMCHLLIERDQGNPRMLIYNRKLMDGSGPSSYGILVCDSMGMDQDFLESAKAIRQIIENNGVSSAGCVGGVCNVSGYANSVSNNKNNNNNNKYNKDKIMYKCEVCGAYASDIHHINQQCNANESGLIDSLTDGIFHKNKLWNLVALCKKCHIDVHSVPCKLIIEEYIKTSDGIVLKFNRDIVSDSVSVSVDVSADNASNSAQDTAYSIAFYDDSSDSDCCKGNKSISVNSNINTDVKTTILVMKNKGNTPRKIQFDIKKQYNVDVKQQWIRELIP
uniref:DNA mismatch repair proteins mutS family domain-containing protein n=1 Tax=viral metagenome TaxID=1070528 RepID=A0A6C0HMV5_9ZZZZ